MQSYISNKFNKRILCILILFVMIYSMFSFIPQFVTKTYAATKTYTYSKTSNTLPSDFDKNYPGYKTLLQTLVKAHPTWTFELYETGLEWDEVIINEYQGHGSLGNGNSPKNLSQAGYYNGEWICPICKKNTYDSGNWHCTSYKAIEYMMDPRNSLNDNDIFQFQNLSSTVANRDAIKKMVSGTFIDTEECINAIFTASKNNKISPYHLVSRIIQEQGTKGSSLGLGLTSQKTYKITGKYAILSPKESIATGSNVSKEGNTYTAITLGDVDQNGKISALDYMKIKNYIMGTSTLNTNQKMASDVNQDGNIKATDYMKIKNHIMGTSTISVSGATNGKKYYNLFNIGAYGDTQATVIANGLAKAEKENWTSMSASIIGGAKFIAQNYIAVGQNTLYYQKFNVVNNSSLYSHQYMQNVSAAQTEGELMRKEYSKYGILESKFVFTVPLYENMPSKACAKPIHADLSASEFMKITASKLNLRTEPNGSSSSKALVDYGTVVKKIEKVGSWYKVLTPKGIGYMSSEYLKEY